MEAETIIDFNAPNLVTVCVMGVIGFFVVAFVWKAISKMRGPKDA